MSESKDNQPKRRFHIPTAEEIERQQEEAEQRLATRADEVSIDMSTSILTSQPQQPASTPTSKHPSNTITSNTATNPASNPHSTSQPTVPSPNRSYSQNLQVNELQRGNPLLTCIRNVRWSYARNILADFEVSRSLGILYLSVKYHRLHPEYISKRITGLGRTYNMRVLLVLVDFQDSKLALREINQAAVVGDMTLLLAWSLDEAGRYIETLKAYEHKQPDAIRERIDESYVAKLNNTLTSIRLPCVQE
ncbi:ssDNA endonuclease and repair protein rad10 [Coemansia brasiliensis]|uniref:SsDNA endonuclease and repair protein rad10 n=1 Tax=Coemansia brasiliensis TaxID=2650707 RepID=A0A9W8I7D2_9FUNG|nr:ssDNA endonuclease and repair protein rad10 [Coemansia brasiliensis]